MSVKNNQIKISVAIATFNEEKNIRYCLNSIKNWADEIIIFDGSSTDKTVEIARNLGATVFVVDNPPHFHTNKQKAIDKCKNSWIFQLDADEELTSQLKEEIAKVISDPENKYSGFYIPRRNYFLAHWMKKTANYPDPVIRLFKKGTGKVPAKNTHEQIEISGSVGWLKNEMLHYGDVSFTRYLIRANRYSTMDARYLKRDNIKITFRFTFKYLFLYPLKTFLLLYFRHQGFRDGMAGFAFSLYSSVHFISTYLKYYESTNQSIDRPEPLDYWA